MNWCDRSQCRVCKHPRPVIRSAGAGPARRAPGPRTSANVRTEAAAVTVSPGQQAEELRQAAQKAKRAGATADALKLLVDAEREARARQAAAKSSKPLDMARTAVEQAAAAVTAADAAIATAEAAVAAARQKAEDARSRHQDKVAELERIEWLRAENSVAALSPSMAQAPVALQLTAKDLLVKALCVTTSLDRMLKNVTANIGIPEDFHKEFADLKLAMSTAQQAQRISLAAATTAARSPTAPDAPVKTLLTAMKQHFEILESGRVLDAGTRGRDLPEDLVDSMSNVQQLMMAIEPVGAPSLYEALEPEVPYASNQGIEDASMGNEESLNATAIAIMEQIQNVSAEEALETVHQHLRIFCGKGIGRGTERFSPGC